MKASMGSRVLAVILLCGCSGRPAGNTGPGQACEADLQPGDLVFTEVMADPSGADEGREWFEVFNASGRDLTLTGVVIASAKPDGTGEVRLALGAVTALAGAYLVFGDAMPAAAPPWMDVPYATGLGSLSQTNGGRLRIWCDDTLVDEVGFPKAPASASWSLDGSQTPDAARNDDPSNWCAATKEYEPDNRGTPGQPNEACASSIPAGSCWDGAQVRPLRVPTVGDLVISEFHANPKAVSDTSGEWVEVWVGKDLDLNGLRLGKDPADLKEVVPAGACREAVAGSWLVFARKTDATVNGGVEGVAGVLPFGLTNTGSNLLILAVGDEVLDQVTYETSWVRDGAATSLDPAHLDPLANDDAAHWCAARTPYGAGDLGTPGAANPPCP